MEEWKSVHIGDLGTIVTGKTPKTSIEDNYGGDTPFLSPSDDLSGKYVPITGRTLSNKGVSEVKNCLLPPQSVCVSCIGSDLGKSVITRCNTITNQQFNSIIPSNGFDTDFVYYAMQFVGPILNALSKTSTAVPIINKSTFSSFQIRVPDYSTQCRISRVLSALDDKIELNNRINHNLEEQAQALYKSWFVDFEPFKDGKFVESELGMIPEGWKVMELKDVTTERRTKVGNMTNIKVLSPVNTGQLVLSEEYFTKQVYSESIAKYLIVEPKDFAYNPARINIGSIGQNEFEFVGCVSPVYVVFRCEDGYNHFFDLYRRTNAFKEEVVSRSIGGVRQTLGYQDLSLIKVIYPTREVVEGFNEVYSRILLTKNHLRHEIESLRQTLNSLLPRLMSGEFKINDLTC